MLRWFREILWLLREIRQELRKFNRPKPTYVRIRIHHHRKETSRMATILQVNETKTFTVEVLDQFGNVFPFDFAANQPSWSVDQPSTVGLAAGGQLQDEAVTGLAVTNTDAIVTVSVPGVANPAAEEAVTVVEAPPPVPVPTSVRIVVS